MKSLSSCLILILFSLGNSGLALAQTSLDSLRRGSSGPEPLQCTPATCGDLPLSSRTPQQDLLPPAPPTSAPSGRSNAGGYEPIGDEPLMADPYTYGGQDTQFRQISVPDPGGSQNQMQGRDVEASAEGRAPSVVGNRPQGREGQGRTPSGQEQQVNQSNDQAGGGQNNNEGSAERRGSEQEGGAEATAGSSEDGNASSEEGGREESARNDGNQENRNPNQNTNNANNKGSGFGMPGFGRNQVAQLPVFEEQRQDIESRIAQGIPACSQKVSWVDQMCGPQSPTMQKAQAAVDRATKNQPTSKSGQAAYTAFSAMMDKANEYFLEYQSKCESIKADCRSQCGTTVQSLQYKQDACGRGLYTCHNPPGAHLAKVSSLSAQCSKHDSRLSNVMSDVMQLTASSVAAQSSAQKMADDAGGTGQATAAAEFQTSGAGGFGAGGPDKFDLYSDELEPGTYNNLQPVDSKPQSTNYSNKGGASGPSVGGGGGSAGYGSAGGTGGGSAGYGAAGSSGGGVIQGYSSGGERSGRSGYGRSGGSGDGSYGAVQRLTRAQYDRLSPEQQARYRKGMQLKDFLPGGSRDPRRLQIAAYQKRDGITGPTGPSIWTKVSNRYRIHQGNLLPP